MSHVANNVDILLFFVHIAVGMVVVFDRVEVCALDTKSNIITSLAGSGCSVRSLEHLSYLQLTLLWPPDCLYKSIRLALPIITNLFIFPRECLSSGEVAIALPCITK
jgi:hypothetical protein